MLLCIQGYKTPWFFDVGLYHAQTVQWIQQYPVIPGLGNLHGRLAFNSHFHLYSAFFSFGSSYHQAATGLIVLVAYIRVFSAPLLFSRDVPRPVFLMITVIWPIIGFWKWYSSPSPDLPVYYLMVIGLLYFLFLKEKAVVLAGILYSLISFKVTSALLILLLVFRIPSFKRYVLAGLLVLAPWLVRNTYLSGYLVYPVHEVDLFSFDFKIPKQIAEAERDEIKYFARRPLDDWELAKDQDILEWLPIWLKQARKSDLLLLGLLLVTCYVHVYDWKYYDRREWYAKAVLLGGVLFWVGNAPAMRFGYGFLIPLLAFQLGCILDKKTLVTTVPRFGTGLFLILICMEVWRGNTLVTNLILPKEYQTISYKKAEVNGMQIKVPEKKGRCWNAGLPCTPYLEEGLELRGKMLKEGFKIRQPVD
jgi:hypothetical protein